MKRGIASLLFVAALAAEAAAQAPSDPVFDENLINTFRLTMSAADWQAIVNADGETWRRAEFQWQSGGTVENVTGVGVKASGHGTLKPREKQSIRISFNEFEFDALKRRWRTINRIKLDSMEGNLDKSFMRDRIAFKLMRDAGNAAPRVSHCRLYVNGNYKGLYIAAEPVRKDFLRYRWGSDDDGNLFEQDGHGSGAYDWRGTSPGSYVPGWFIEENASAPVNYGDLVQLIDIVNNKSGEDRRATLASLIDYPAFLRHLAVTTVYGDNDDIAHWGGGWCNNHYWYHHESGKMQIIKWDPDASQGRFYTNADQPLGYQWGQSDMLDWISGDSVVWNDYKAAVAAVLGGPAAGVQARIDAIYNQIRQLAYDDPLKSFSDAEFDSGKDFLKDWWRRRTTYLGTQVTVTNNNNATFVSQTVPSSMVAGQAYSVSVVMKNTGTTTWTAPGYALRSQNPADNTTWGLSNIPVPASIAPNQNATFTFTVTAPATAGTYAFNWQLRQSGVEWFGPVTNASVSVTTDTTTPPPPAAPINDADYVSQTVPSAMVAGQTYSVTVRMKNTGTTTWTIGESYHLRSQNPPKNFTWGVDRADLGTGESIAPGQEKTFTWTVTAPATAGTYNFQWQMRRSTTDEFFGDLTPNVVVTVGTTAPPPPPGGNDAAFVSQTVPTSMVAGQTYTVSVAMRNTGGTTWSQASNYRLGSQNPQDNMTWGMNRVAMDAGETTAPGGTKTFTWTVTAPATAGSYNFQWRMRQSGVEWFGATTPNVAVLVSGPAEPPPPGADLGAGYVATSSRNGENANGDQGINDACTGSIGAGAPMGAGGLALLALLCAGLRRR